MLDLFYGLEPNIALHATVLACGCAIFVAVLMVRCPRCAWQEWVSELLGDDRDGRDN